MSEEQDLNNNNIPEDPIAKLEREKEEYLNGWKRAKADLINYKKKKRGVWKTLPSSRMKCS